MPVVPAARASIASSTDLEPREAREIVVEKEGFRPSEWVNMLAAMGDGRGSFRYRDDLFPRYVNGQPVLVVRSELSANDPPRFEHMLEFARRFGLNVHVDPRLATVDAGAWAALQRLAPRSVSASG